MKIPIQNIYYLLCYAWNKLEEKDIISVEPINQNKVIDLFAKILCSGLSHLIRLGLDRGYVLYDEQTERIRGKIDFNTTLKKLMNKPKFYCSYDELSFNVLHNQILKSTIRMLISCEDLDDSIHDELVFIFRKFQDIKNISLEKKHFRPVQLNRNNLFYDFLLKICELIIDNLLISEDDGKSKFRDFLQDDRSMSALFEEFVRNFYKREQNQYKVSSDKIYWDALSYDKRSADSLPEMKTDITLVSPERKIIIDTKYYSEVLQTHYDKKKIRSDNLYQLYAYIKNSETQDRVNINCEGILLYPTTEEDLDLRYAMKEHKISVKTINLNQDWKKIHEDLLKIIN